MSELARHICMAANLGMRDDAEQAIDSIVAERDALTREVEQLRAQRDAVIEELGRTVRTLGSSAAEATGASPKAAEDFGNLITVEAIRAIAQGEPLNDVTLDYGVSLRVVEAVASLLGRPHEHRWIEEGHPFVSCICGERAELTDGGCAASDPEEATDAQ